MNRKFFLAAPNICEQISRWTMFVEEEQERGAVIVFVGNKCDLKQRRQDKRSLDKVMAECGAQYMEISAKTGYNVKELLIPALLTRCPYPIPKPQKNEYNYTLKDYLRRATKHYGEDPAAGNKLWTG
uniref:Ras family protein n=1 Tax=Angiostrongylus cantonensis TaxID=6313 RepID=A0A0K0DMU9_ANGCA